MAAVYPDFKMQVGAGSVSCFPDIGNDIPLFDSIPQGNVQLGGMGI